MRLAQKREALLLWFIPLPGTLSHSVVCGENPTCLSQPYLSEKPGAKHVWPCSLVPVGVLPQFRVFSSVREFLFSCFPFPSVLFLSVLLLPVRCPFTTQHPDCLLHMAQVSGTTWRLHTCQECFGTCCVQARPMHSQEDTQVWDEVRLPAFQIRKFSAPGKSSLGAKNS